MFSRLVATGIAFTVTVPLPRVALADEAPATSIADRERATVVRKDLPEGSYLQYVPRQLSSPGRVVVIVHGSLGDDDAAISAADEFIRRWTSLADESGCVLIAPAFDQENFGGRAGPGGGYRGLFGRHVGADDFVNRIVDRYKALLPGYDGTINLYGHSAGGQFASRYVVRHPQRIRAAVISAAGTFAYPDPDVRWTNGMAPLARPIRWSDDEPLRDIAITPDPDGWLAAAQLPITVVVGEQDIAECKPIAGHRGNTHVARARSWVADMRELARKHGKRSGVRVVCVRGVGHNSKELTPECQRHISRSR